MPGYIWSRILALLALTLVTFSLLSSETRQIILTDGPTGSSLLSNSDLGFELRYQIAEMNVREVSTPAGMFDELQIEGMGFSNVVGSPKLPMDRKLIAVPIGADVSFTVLDKTEREPVNDADKLKHRVIPVQPSISKAADASYTSFDVNEEAYSLRGFEHAAQIQITELGFLRGVRLFALDYYPLGYDPSQNRIRVIEDLTLRVDFHGADLAATNHLLAKTWSYEFESLYSKTIYNWRPGDRSSLLRYPTRMLILCPAAYTTVLQPFVTWKIQQGYDVSVTTVGAGGQVANNSTAISNYMMGIWNAATPDDPAPSYLLIVGDTAYTGDNIIAPSGNTGSHPTDLTYVRLQGTDYFPELYFGRISVSSSAELTGIIEKTLMYEQTTMPDLSYLENAILIAGADAQYSSTFANGQINYAATHYFNGDHGINSATYLYPASANSDIQILQGANAGCAYINYTAHGSPSGWTDPIFTVSHLNEMTNAGKYMVGVGNSCLTNQFTTDVCFGEAFIRASNKAGVAYIGASNDTYWSEDYWWGIGYKTPIQANAHAYNPSSLGAYDAMFHTHGEAFVNWGTTVAEANFMGNLAVQQSGSWRSNYYWEIYSIMGDPSLMPYYGVPTVNNVSYAGQIINGAESFNVTAEPFSRVTLSVNGELWASGIVPSTGNLNLPLTSVGRPRVARLVITAQNKITIMDNIPIFTSSGPQVLVDAVSYEDGDNNLLDYGDSGVFTVSFSNLGSLNAENVVSTLSCNTPGITITDAVENIALVSAGDSITVSAAFALTIAADIMDGTSAHFNIITTCGSLSLNYQLNMEINAPCFAFGSLYLSDPDPGNNSGELDPGETALAVIELSNTGSSLSQAGIVILGSPTPGISILTPQLDLSPLAAGETRNLVFTVSASPAVLNESQFSLDFAVITPSHSAQSTRVLQIGDGLPAPEPSISLSAGGILLQWAALPQAEQYHIYRAWQALGPFVFLAATPESSFLDTELTGRAFYYVKAVKIRSHFSEDD